MQQSVLISVLTATVTPYQAVYLSQFVKECCTAQAVPVWHCGLMLPGGLELER
jgi:hypothetical protein